MADSGAKARKVEAAHLLQPLDKPGKAGNKDFMVIESIRGFKWAVPFKPFEIKLVNGKRFKVPRADVIGISPNGSQVIVIDANDCTHQLSSSLIKGVSLQKRRRAAMAIPDAIDNAHETGHKDFMVIQSIREFNEAVPFKPYEIQMVSGLCYKVPHPDFVWISPRASYVIVSDADERPHHLSTLLIESVSLQKSRPKRKTAKH